MNDSTQDTEKPRPVYFTLTDMQRRVLMLVLIIAFFSLGGPEKCSEAVSASVGWDDEARREYDAQIKLNEAYLTTFERNEAYYRSAAPKSRRH